MDKITVTRSVMPDRAVFDTYVDQIFKTGWLTNNGALVQELERRLSAYLGVKNIVLVTNGTLALQIAAKLLGLQGEIITTPFTFVATASAMVWDHLRVRFADIEKESLNLDAAAVEQIITPRTCAILPVHVFGNPCRVEQFEAIAGKYDLKLIYDASHAFNVGYKGQSLLNHGDISTLSFHATKLFHTIEGGALVIKDDDLCAHARKMINFGITGPETIECLGINAKMNEFQAAMGLSLLDKMDEAIARRKLLCLQYDEYFKNRIIRQAYPEECTRNYAYYPVIFPDESTLKRAQAKLEAAGIFPRRYFYPSLCDLDFLVNVCETITSKNISRRIMCLPLFPDLTHEQCHAISHMVLSVLEDKQ